jgi:hypothetical protein
MAYKFKNWRKSMLSPRRPFQAKLFAFLLFLSSLATGFVGLAANGYLVPALCLLIMAVLLWFGRGRIFLSSVIALNLASGLVLILALWAGGALGYAKLDLAGAALLCNLLCGGPLMSMLGAPLLMSLRAGKTLPAWFAAT